MNNSKRTRNALVSSVVALAICFSMFVGTTMAWFTDTATAGVNTIVAGTLDVVLEMKVGDEWKNAEGEVLNFKKALGGANETILWEPGVSYELPELRITNNGDIALEYQIVVTGLTDTKSATTSLLEVIDFTMVQGSKTTVVPTTYKAKADGVADSANSLAPKTSTEAFKLVGTWEPSENDNKYMGLKAAGAAITVYATQEESEHDSYNNTYDATAEYAAQLPHANVTITGPKANLGYLDVDFSNLTNTKVATDKISLDFSYSYEATQTKEQAGDYTGWAADFRITADRAVAEGEVYIAGQYDGWADKWGHLAGLDPEDDDNWIQLTGAVNANEPMCLLNGMVTYGELLDYNTPFNCGGYATSALASDLTITVELILVNPADANDILVLGVQKHTFVK